jgi:LysR family nod box-dependent transcriptional activator
MRFKGFDLNHLMVLDHLLTERSVSRAAEKLGRTQSTVSGILARLREQFDDDLLVQVGREMTPTARGNALASVVRDLLLQVDAVILTPPGFDPALSDRRIKIFASDYLMIAGLADAMHKISKLAPNLKFDVLQPTQFQRPSEGPAALLETGEIDFLAMPQTFLSPHHPTLPLFTETCCCIVDRDNQAVGAEVSIEHFLQMRHVTVSFGPGAVPSYEEWFIRQYGAAARRIEVTAGSFATMPFLLPGTQRIALTHRRLAEAYTRILPIRIVEARFGIPPLVEAIQWHKYNTTDAALAWVRDQIVASMAAV